jgi:hypothetical protein
MAIILKATLEKEWLKQKLLLYKTQRELSEKEKIPIHVIENNIRFFNLKGYKDSIRYTCVEEKFSLNNPEFCYLLGLYVTDGYWNEGGLCISLLDKDVLERLGKIFDCRVYLHPREGKASVYILTIPTRFCNYFKVLGYSIGAKTFTIKLPSLPIPTENLKYIIRGMIDGDGTIRKGIHEYECRFFSASKLLLENYKCMLTYLGYTYTLANHVKYGESTVSVASLDFLLYIYTDRLDLCLDRKLKIVNNKVDDIVHTYSIVKNRRM